MAFAFPHALLPRVNARTGLGKTEPYLLLCMWHVASEIGQKHSIFGAYIPAISRRSKGKPQCNIAGKC
jgi:hypothetical protein